MTDKDEIPAETLMAYADGEVDPLTAKRVERAIAADSTLAERVDQHRALTASLRATYAPVEAAPLPNAVTEMLTETVKIVPFRAPTPVRRERSIWIGAVAASLVAGLIAGPLVFPKRDPGIAIEDGQAVARGEIATVLGTQLASTQRADAPVRIGVTFRDGQERLCRTFVNGATGGIACAEGDAWRLERLYGGVARQGTAYRQASSGAAAMMADAQAMMRGEPLDANAEAAALKGR
ncbi:anti-sigma factor [Sphingomonas suaedae]|uniref:Anti-sigma factor n=1 Tax=Sphingomonas suaedae TaxID=2599297 RepID=A0A518RCM7_9SPHN|nr:anti-sigma factor [Sphingomonas suaedae]QDX25190.1 anti-sigma factor [Sphingomonas suaedae]